MKKVWRWIEATLKKRKRKAPLFTILTVEHLPKRLTKNKLYLVGDDECSWAIGMLCPCGCRDVIHLNLASDSTPSWRLHVDKKNGISLFPSVWRTVGCRSHFTIRRSRLEWYRE